MTIFRFGGAVVLLCFVSWSGASEAAAAGLSASSSASAITSVHDRALVERLVRENFSASPVMIEIARCESNFRQFADSGSVFRGGAGGGMVGVFQIFAAVHENAADSLGFDIETLEGNIGYAKHLFERSGATPWQSCVPVLKEREKQLQLIDLMKQLIALLQKLIALQSAAN